MEPPVVSSPQPAPYPSRTMRGAPKLILLAGIAATVGGLFLPWIEIDGDRPFPGAAGVLDALGVRPASEPVSGWEILDISIRTGSDPVLRASLAVSELLAGRPERAAARALFGDRYEEKHAWIVLLPAVLALLHVPLLRRSSSRAWRPLAAGIDSGTLIVATVAVAKIPGAGGSVPLAVLAGLPVTILGLLAMAAALLAALLPAGPRRR